MPAVLDQLRQRYPRYASVPDDKIASGLYQKFYADKMSEDDFHKAIGYTPPEPSLPGEIGNMALGAAENAGAAIANIPGGIANAAADFASRATGHTEGAHPVPMVQPGQAGRDFGRAGADLLERGIEAIPGAGNAVASGVGGVNKAATNFAENYPALASGAATAADAAQLLPAAAAGQSLTRAVRGVTSAAGDAEQAAATAAQQARWKTLGLPTGDGSGVARFMAGKSGVKAQQVQGAEAGAAIAQGEAGVPQTQLLGADTLEQARVAPEAVFARVAKAVPEGPLDEAASSAADAVPAKLGQLATTSENTQSTVQGLVDRLKMAKTGDARLDDLRSLRQQGYRQLADDNVDTQAIGKAKLSLADAVEGHITRAIPQGADVTPDQFTAARTALGKNWTVDSVLSGNNVDLNALARIQKNSPNLLTGSLRDLADWASKNKGLVGPVGRVEAPTVGEDVKGIVNLHAPIKGAIEGAMGALGRRLLTGGSAAGRATARAAVPGRVGDDFAAIPPSTPPGGAGGPPGAPGGQPGAPGGPAGGPAGGVSLHDMLSQGAEQSPSPGPPAGPVGAGGLEPSPEDTWFHGGAQKVGDDVAYGKMLVNNGSAPGAEGAGSLEATGVLKDAKAAGVRRFRLDAEGTPSPLAGLDARDPTYIKGQPVIDVGPDGEPKVIDRAGVPAQALKGLLARFKTLHLPKLGDGLVTE